MQITDPDELRQLVAKLTVMGSRVIWDGDRRVRSIAMFGKQITDRDLSLLRQVPGLRDVNLTRTRISDAGLFHLSRLASLEILLLGGTDVTDEGCELLAELVDLQQLNLTNTGITDRGLNMLSRMPKLEALWLDGTDVSDAAMEVISGLTSLQLLDLRRTGVTNAGVQRIRHLTALEELNLTGCQEVTGDGLASLRELRRLEWLSLDATAVDDAGLQHLVELPLKTLSLNWTAVGDGALNWLRRMPGLESLHVLGTRIGDDAIAAFRAARPACSVHHCR
jgi:hypothetical protein